MSTEDTPKPVALPDPDTHCWDDDTNSDVWSYSPGLMRATIDAAVAKERERCAKVANDILTQGRSPLGYKVMAEILKG
jgi:hypothetical protein